MSIQRMLVVFLSGIMFVGCLSEDPRFTVDSTHVESTPDHETTPEAEVIPQEEDEISPTPVSSTPVPIQSPTPPTNEESEEEWVEKECPPEWFFIAGGTYEVGAPPEIYNQGDGEGYMVSRVPLYTTSIEAFCISPFPYPGEEGSKWPEGLGLDGVIELNENLKQFNLRLATGSEYFVSVSTHANDQWPKDMGSWSESRCDPDPNNPALMGSYPNCASPLGPGALLTFGLWVSADSFLKETLLATTSGSWPKVNEFIVLGGMPTSWNAFYGDDLWGGHQHDAGEVYNDDKAGFVVSEPWAVGESDLENFQTFVSEGSAKKMINQNKRHPTRSELFQRQ